MLKSLLIILFISASLSLTPNFKFGLRSKDNHPLKLLDLQTKAIIEGPYVHIEYTHTYYNPYNKPLETEFYFPRTDNSVFHKFEAIFQNQTIVGQVLEKTKAKEMYEWNVQQGNTVAYSERNALVPDVMQILVGNIPAGETVDIRFSVIQPLEVVVNQFWGFTLPSVLIERYTSSSVDPSQVPNIVNVELENSMYKDWKVFVEVRSDASFEYIVNPSHKIKPEFVELASGTNSKIYKAVWNVTIVPNKDFVVYFRPAKLEIPSVITATHSNYTNDYVMLVNFVPQLNSLNTHDSERRLENNEEGYLELKRLALEEDVQNAKGEFMFVIDRSGSMEGESIENLKRALIKFLQVLPKDSFFNVISFGSEYSLYSPESIKYTPEALNKIVETWIPTIKADMGGTEILIALQKVSSLPLINGYPRTIMLLTDGEVYNPSEVINHVRIDSDKMRLCSVGIGHGASEHLVKNSAKAGKCTSVFVKEDEDIGEKAIFMIKAAVSRYLENINFIVTCFDNENREVYKQEDKVGMLLKDIAFKQWVYLKGIENLSSCKVRLEYYNSLKEEKFTEEVQVNSFQTAEVTDIWHKVAYDAHIRELDLMLKSQEEEYEDTKDLKIKVVNLSIKYQVLTDYTSFLAVIKENAQDKNEGRIKVTIPNLDSADHEGGMPVRGKGARFMMANRMAAPLSMNFAKLGGGGHSADLFIIDLPVADEGSGDSAFMPGQNVSADDYFYSNISQDIKTDDAETSQWPWGGALVIGICLCLLVIAILWLRPQKKSKIEIKKKLGVQD